MPRAIFITLFLLPLIARAADRTPAKINFSRDIHPVLAENCFACHGFDEKARKAKLRLDTRDGATKPGKHQAIVPNHPDQSEAVRRILTTDPDDQMPPPDSGKKLTPKQIDILQQWIAQGADYAGHWSFQPIKPEPVPANQNPIDYFIQQTLQSSGLHMSPPADKATLLRRVTFDLTGLPPTLEDLDAFLADPSPDAYGKVVDRLLASPHYGERMALDWLDAARFADTHGYHIDAGRDMTRWREYVIDAFNRNKPFDQFTIEQLAGDLLSNATTEQKIASGFHRNHMINFEGGAIPEEYLTAYIMDRVNTTATVFLGLTVACAQCHDHKYDPIKQKEYYQLYAFFNNVPENGLDGRKGNAVPLIKTPTPDEEKQLAAIAAQIKQIEQSLDAPNPDADVAQLAWEQSAATANVTTWTHLDPTQFHSAGNASLAKLPDQSIRATGANPTKETYTIHLENVPANTTALRLETLSDDALPAKGPGRGVNGNFVLTEFKVQASNDKYLKLKKATADFAQKDFPAQNAIDNKSTGWAIYPQVAKPHHLIVELEKPLATASPLRVIIECQSEFPSHQPGRIRLSATSSPNPHEENATPASIVKILNTPADKRTPAQQSDLRRHYRATISPLFADAQKQLATLRQSQKDLDGNLRTTMVMEESPKPRETHILLRGQYDKPGDKVTPNTPTALPALTSSKSPNRLDLAKWLTSPDQPLTSRVIVNRFWQMYFGTGLVKTAEDFGTQGEFPTHPELLDHLAHHFMTTGWDVKALQRLIVTSATYRQSSTVTPDLIAKDPENRLLARGPRFRLQAEFVRDQALALSGLLNEEIGGKSVSPYQPAGLWEELMSRSDGANWTAQTYTQSHGKDLYRRTMYTFWKRTSPPPTLSTFDAPDREVCTVRRARTNTPLQALVLLNDPTYIEASRKLAERLLTNSTHPTDDAKLSQAFRLATARNPNEKELPILRDALQQHLTHYRAHPEAATQLLTLGESPTNPTLDKPQLAAWTLVSSIILNLDETVTKN